MKNMLEPKTRFIVVDLASGIPFHLETEEAMEDMRGGLESTGHETVVFDTLLKRKVG